MLVTVLPQTVTAQGIPGSLNNFAHVNTYTPGQFSDVKASDWFSNDVAMAYELGLMKGARESDFNATGNLTIAESITLAARIHSIYMNDSESFTQGSPWYRVYIDYALNNGIIKNEYSDYNKTATRKEIANIFVSALPISALAIINDVDAGMIPDVPIDLNESNSIYMLYRAGILTGSDAIGTFYPNTNIGRNAAAAIVSRMTNESFRKSIKLVRVVAETVHLNESSYVMYEGETFDLVATVLPNDTTDKSLQWDSSNPSIATVSDGNVVAISEGNTIITCKTSNGIVASCSITIEKIPVSATVITLNQQSASLFVGDTINLNVTFVPENTTEKNIEWSSSNTKVAQVSDGLVSCLAQGNSIITATSANGKSASCSISVKSISVSSVTLSKTSIGITDNTIAVQLVATINPANASNQQCLWSSSNQNVATVDTQWDKPNGNIAFIQPIGNGTTTITVTTMDGNKVAKCTVTVKDTSVVDFLNTATTITSYLSKIDSALAMADYYVSKNTLSGMNSAVTELSTAINYVQKAVALCQSDKIIFSYDNLYVLNSIRHIQTEAENAKAYVNGWISNIYSRSTDRTTALSYISSAQDALGSAISNLRNLVRSVG